MTYTLVAKHFKTIAEIPKDNDIYYQCVDCDDIIPSVPNDNIGCKCGNIFIDKDYWRLIIVDLTKIKAIKKA